VVPNATDSPEHWRKVRRLLHSRRHDLGTEAARLYPSMPRVAGTTLLCRPEWIPAEPLALEQAGLA
jgi:hypothetical protein